MTADDPPRPETGPLAPTDGLRRLQRFTPARIALGRVGSGQPTAASLRFALDHARARDAVHSALDFEAIGKPCERGVGSVRHAHSAASDRAEYLRRPDLGRRLSSSGPACLGGPDAAEAMSRSLPPTASPLRLSRPTFCRCWTIFTRDCWRGPLLSLRLFSWSRAEWRSATKSANCWGSNWSWS